MTEPGSDQSALRDPAFMKAFLNVVIPPDDERSMPGAGNLRLAEGVADALEADATLGPPVKAGLRAVREASDAHDGGFASLALTAQVELIEQQLEAHPNLMSGLIRYLYLAYYQHPAVLVSIGEPARPRFPGGFEVEATDPELLELLQSRRP